MFTKAKVVTRSNIVITFLKRKLIITYAFNLFFVLEHIFCHKHFVVYGDLESKSVNRGKLCNSDKVYHSIFVYFY